MLKLIKNLYRKLKQQIFKVKNPVGEKIAVSKDSFNMQYFNNIEWIYYGGSYYPYHIINTNGQKYYIPYVSTERIKEGANAGSTIMNKFLITKN
jgi:pantothenate kinase